MPLSREVKPGRPASGKLDILIIAMICVILAMAFLFVLFKIIGHSEEHVDKVRKTKVKFKENLAWRPDSELCERRIRKDLEANPNKRKAEYKELSLNEQSLIYIGRMSNLQKLDLTRSIVKDDWLRHITELPLTHLYLFGTSLTDKAIPYILELRYLQTLKIGDTDITDSGLEQLSSYKGLAYLDLELAKQVTNDGIKFISKMSGLRSLSLSDMNLSADCLIDVVKLKDLRELRMERIPLTGDQIRLLSKLKNLYLLNIARTGVGDKDLADISKLSNLSFLNLSCNTITDKGLTKLYGLKHLKHLSLEECPHLSEAAVAKLKKALPKCRIKYSRSLILPDDLTMEDLKHQVNLLETGSSDYLDNKLKEMKRKRKVQDRKKPL